MCNKINNLLKRVIKLLLLGGIAESDPAYCDTVTVARSVRHYVCMLSVTLLHPATATGQNKMPFGRDTCVTSH